MQLSPHFTLAEMTRSQAASRLGILNDPNPTQLASLIQLCTHVLEPVRAHFGPVQISSGFRCPALNKLIGGAATSQHLKGQAADIIVPGHKPAEVCAWIAEHVPFDQLIHEFGDWTHVSFNPLGSQRRSKLTARYVDGSVHYFVGLPPP